MVSVRLVILSKFPEDSVFILRLIIENTTSVINIVGTVV